MANDNLTDQEQLFLDYLFTGLTFQDAAEQAGYHPGYGHALARRLKQAVIDTAEEVLAMEAVKAAHSLSKALTDDGSLPNANIRLQAAQQILDRTGLGRKDRVEISTDGPAAIFLLPHKNDERTPDQLPTN